MIVYQVWIQPGAGLADDYLTALESFTNNNPEQTILLILFVFACFHSGLAGLRPQGGWIMHARHAMAKLSWQSWLMLPRPCTPIAIHGASGLTRLASMHELMPWHVKAMMIHCMVQLLLCHEFARPPKIGASGLLLGRKHIYIPLILWLYTPDTLDPINCQFHTIIHQWGCNQTR